MFLGRACCVLRAAVITGLSHLHVPCWRVLRLFFWTRDAGAGPAGTVPRTLMRLKDSGGAEQAWQGSSSPPSKGSGSFSNRSRPMSARQSRAAVATSALLLRARGQQLVDAGKGKGPCRRLCRLTIIPPGYATPAESAAQWAPGSNRGPSYGQSRQKRSHFMGPAPRFVKFVREND